MATGTLATMALWTPAMAGLAVPNACVRSQLCRMHPDGFVKGSNSSFFPRKSAKARVCRLSARNLHRRWQCQAKLSGSPTQETSEVADLAQMVAAENWSGGWPGGEAGLRQWVDSMELHIPEDEMAQYIQYDPDRLAKLMEGRQWEVTTRLLDITTALGKIISNLVLDNQTGRMAANMPQRASELRETLVRLGPTFIKTGQALSARPDLMPPPYLEQLGILQDNLQSFPSSIAYSVIEKDLGRPVKEMFSSLSPEPVAAASLGQVYKGVLRSTGETVAVKVQRPGITDTIALDMFLVRKLGAWIDTNTELLTTPLVPLIDEFALRLFGELDYIQEGKNAERFEELYGSIPRIRVPRILWEYSSRRVLVMEWIDGVKLTNVEGMAAYGLDVIDFVDIGINCTLRQLLEHGFFHADPHPGNLLATKAGDLVYLDFGMMSMAPQSARYAIISHVVHLVNRDYEAMARDYYTLDFLAPEVDTTPIVPALRDFFDKIFADGADVSRLNFKSIVDGLGEVMLQFPFNVPAYYALILRTLTVLEGLAMYTDPNYKLLARAYPYIARRLLTDPSPELRGSLEELILENGKFRWNRLENLLRESRKSNDLDSSQLWLLLEYLVSDKAKSIREPLAKELSLMVDAVGVNSTRNITKTLGASAGLPQDTVDKFLSQIAPMTSKEQSAVMRARMLASAVQGTIANMLPTSRPASTQAGARDTGASQGGAQQLKGSNDAARITSGSGVSSGPVMGLPETVEVFARGMQNLPSVGEITKGIQAAAPHIQQLAITPGTQEFVRDVTLRVVRRFLARAARAVFANAGLVRESGKSAAAAK